MAEGLDPEYTMGRSDAETRRLIEQADLYGPATRAAFESAGMGPGMKILDIGTGAGDLALSASSLVGEGGFVLGVDSNPAVLETARARVREFGLTNIEFIEDDFRNLDSTSDFDFVVGRLVLMYQADPMNAMRDVVRHLKPTGRVVFQEWDSRTLGDYFAHFPELRHNRQFWDWVLAAFEKSGVDTELGFKLPRSMLEAGLCFPSIATYAAMGGPRDWLGFQSMAAILSSVSPLIEKFGIASRQDLDIDGCAERLRLEVEATGVAAHRGTLVSAWASKA